MHSIRSRAAVLALLIVYLAAGGELSAATTALPTQDAAGGAAAPASSGAASAEYQPGPAVPSTSPLTVPPRTLRAYWHLFGAFAITWLLLFGYTVTVGRRWARLEREVQALRVE